MDNTLTEKNASQILTLLVLSVKMIFLFYGFADSWIDKISQYTGVMHEGDHACSPGQTLITLISYRTNVHVPFIACVINLASAFTYYLDLLNLLDCGILEF